MHNPRVVHTLISTPSLTPSLPPSLTRSLAHSLAEVQKPQIQRMNSTAQKLVDAAIDDDSAAVKELLSSKTVDVNARDWEDATVLHAAASRGDVELVDYIVKSQQADVNLFDSSHRSALMDAAQRGHRQVVEILVAAGAEIDSVNIAGSTPLMMAAEKGFVSVVEFLLEQSSVDVNRQDSMGATALIRACQQAPDTDGLVASIGALLQVGADVNIGSYGVGGDKPVALTHALDVAISSDEQLEVVKLLLDHKTSLRDKQGEGENSSSSSSDDENSENVNDDINFGLLSAAWNGKTRLAEMLLAAGADVDHSDGSTNVTALMYAAANGHESIVKILLDRGADAKRIHSTGGTALFESCINGTSALIFNLLMNAGADPFVTDSDNVTCLMAAAESGNVEIVTALLRAGLLINGVSAAGATPLMHAANANKSDIVRLLAERNADFNVAVNATPAYIAKNRADFEMGTTTELYEHGLTALMMASKMAFLPIVKILVEAGARIELADAQQQTAVVHAARNSSFALDVETFLVEKGADPNAMIWDKLNGDKSLLLHAVVNNQTDLALLLLQKGANASFADEDGVTVATHAAFLGNLRVVRELISRNADIASANFEGTDPLIAASAEGHVEIVAELLKSKRVNIHNKDIDGTNALMAASVRGHKEVAKLLVSAGVNVNAQNSEGHTALMFAFNGKHQVELLLEKYREYQKSGEDNSTVLLRNALTIHTSIIQLLRRSGADAKLTDNWGHEASDFDKVKLGSTEAAGPGEAEEL